MEKGKDTFRNLLRRMLDETGIHTRVQWAIFFSVPEIAIEEWLRGEVLPSAEYLRMLWGACREADDVPKDILDEMDAVEKCRPEDISFAQPHDILHLDCETLQAYIASPVVKGFLRRLGHLSGENQEKLITEAMHLFDKYKRE